MCTLLLYINLIYDGKSHTYINIAITITQDAHPYKYYTNKIIYILRCFVYKMINLPQHVNVRINVPKINLNVTFCV